MHMVQVAERFAEIRRFDSILDDLNTHRSLPVCRLVAQLSDTAFSKTRRQQERGRTCFSPRAKTYERLLYPPRPCNQNAV